MELIKKIKQAETQAQEVVEQANVQSAQLAEQRRKSRAESFEEEQVQRKADIEASVKAAIEEGLKEVTGLKAQAQKDRNQLREKAGAKQSGATAKVMDYLKG